MEPLSIKQAILYVQDMQAQVEFYRDVLELCVKYPIETSYQQTPWVVFEAGGIELALHMGGNREFGSDSPCLVFQCHEIEAVHAELTKRGVALDPVFFPVPGTKVANGTDPEGNRFSLKQVDNQSYAGFYLQPG
jgi:predicted enzyme related to lactoylglutathione lyase